jgi:hypothetical protein
LECGDLSPLNAAATGRNACSRPKGKRRQVAALVRLKAHQIREVQVLSRQTLSGLKPTVIASS